MNSSADENRVSKAFRAGTLFDVRGYFRRGFTLEEFPSLPNVSARGNVVLIHGLLMRAPSMSLLAERFTEAGFRALVYDYPTSRLGVFRHGEILRERLRALLGKLPVAEKMFFVTHSMGGILLRVALSDFSREELARVAAVAMFAPPNQGSFWPERVRKIFPPARFLCRCLSDLRCTEDSPLRRIPLPKNGPFPPLLIVRGERDAKVAPQFLPLPGVPARIVSVPCGHAALRRSREAFAHALNFFSAPENFF